MSKILPFKSGFLSASPRVAGPMFMIVSALLFTCLSTIVKLLPDAYTVWHVGFIRCAGGIAILVALPSKKKNPFEGHNLPILMFRGCTGSLAFFCLVSSLRILPMSTAIVLFYAYPVFAALFGFLIYRERINLPQFACIAVLVAGVAVMFDFHLTGSFSGQVLAVAAAVLVGLTVTLIRSLRQHNSSATIYLYFCIMGALFTLPYCIAHPIVPSGPGEWAMTCGIILTSILAQLTMNQGFFHCKGFEGAAYMSCEAVFTALVGILLMNDPVSLSFMEGALLIVGSGLALNFVTAGEGED